MKAYLIGRDLINNTNSVVADSVQGQATTNSHIIQMSSGTLLGYVTKPFIYFDNNAKKQPKHYKKLHYSIIEVQFTRITVLIC